MSESTIPSPGNHRIGLGPKGTPRLQNTSQRSPEAPTLPPKGTPRLQNPSQRNPKVSQEGQKSSNCSPGMPIWAHLGPIWAHLGQSGPILALGPAAVPWGSPRKLSGKSLGDPEAKTKKKNELGPMGPLGRHRGPVGIRMGPYVKYGHPWLGSSPTPSPLGPISPPKKNRKPKN